MGWTKYNENLLRKYSKHSKTYANIHTKTSQYYERYQKIFGIPMVLLGAILSCSIFTTDENSQSYLKYVNGFLALFLACLSGVNNLMNFSLKIQKNNSACLKYSQIYLDIELLLNFPRSERNEQPSVFINDIKKTVIAIQTDCETPPAWITSGFIDQYDSGLTNLSVKVDRSDSKTNSISRSVSQSQSQSYEGGNTIQVPNSEIVPTPNITPHQPFTFKQPPRIRAHSIARTSLSKNSSGFMSREHIHISPNLSNRHLKKDTFKLSLPETQFRNARHNSHILVEDFCNRISSSDGEESEDSTEETSNAYDHKHQTPPTKFIPHTLKPLQRVTPLNMYSGETSDDQEGTESENNSAIKKLDTIV